MWREREYTCQVNIGRVSFPSLLSHIFISVSDVCLSLEQVR